MISSEMAALSSLDQVNSELASRNAIRLKEAKEKMGQKFLLHPANSITKEKFRKVMRITQKAV